MRTAVLQNALPQGTALVSPRRDGGRGMDAMTPGGSASADSGGPAAQTDALAVQGLHKCYSGVHAFHDVSSAVPQGQVVGLVGDNGAGKTTLIKILSGIHEPHAGTIVFEGRPVVIRSPRAARELGIETIHHDNSTIHSMSVRATSSSRASRCVGPSLGLDRWTEPTNHLFVKETA